MPSHEDHSVDPQDLIQAGLDKSTKIVVKKVKELEQEASATLNKVETDVDSIQRKAGVLIQKVTEKAPDDPELSKRKDATDEDDNFYSLYRRFERKFSAELMAFYNDSTTKLINNGTCPPLHTSDAPYRIHVYAGVVCPISIGFLIMLGSIPETKLTFPRLEKVYTIALNRAGGTHDAEERRAGERMALLEGSTSTNSNHGGVSHAPGATGGGLTSGYQSLPNIADARARRSGRLGSALDYSDMSDDDLELKRRMHAVHVAAMYIRAALFDRRISFLTDPDSLWYVRVYESSGMRALVDASLLGYLLITFYEKNDGSQPAWTYVVETFAWTFLAVMFSLRVRFTDLKQLQRSLFAKIHAFALTVALIDLIASIYMNAVAHHPYYRYARVVRPLLQLEYSHLVRRRVIDILRTCWRVRAAFLLLAFEITFFAVVAIFLFYGSEEGDQFFNSMGESIVTLVILLSTCNSPSVMVPAYESNPWSALFFVCFLVVSVFLMLNLLLAVIYKEHRRHLLHEAKRQAVRKRACTSAAFRVLRQESMHSLAPALRPTSFGPVGVPDGLVADLLVDLGVNVEDAPLLVSLLGEGRTPGFVFRDDFEDVLLVLHFTIKEHASEEEEVDAFFGDNDMIANEDAEGAGAGAGATQDGTNAASGEGNFNVSGRSFFNGSPMSRTRSDVAATPMSGHLSEAEISSPGSLSRPANVRRSKPMSRSRQIAIRLVKHEIWIPCIGRARTLDLAVNTLLIVSGLITVTALSVDIDVVIYDDPLPFRIINRCCTLLFATEIAVRVHAASPRRFFESAWNTFEFIIVSASLIGTLSQVFTPKLSGHTHLLLFLRKLRLLRLLRSVPQFRLLTEMIVYLLPALYIFSRVIFFFMYIIAIVAMGTLDMQLQDASDFAATNFLTFANALLTLFQLMVVNDWNKTMRAYYAATGNPLVYVFFIANYLFSVMVVLNVVTSFALEALDKNIADFALLQDAVPAGDANSISSTERLELQMREQARLQQRRQNSRRERDLFQGRQSRVGLAASVGDDRSDRELKRTFSYVERLQTVRKVNRVVRAAPRESHLVRLLRDVFDNEMDEPTIAEINQELRRNGLSNLLSRPAQRDDVSTS
ncbi:Two pore calcium channel protein 1 [Hondaea fermentalgiana]|uniref:Two pore calcium channel protein 1 n=1 Tax=Hondaea fermentalgiana TaxID=2315210 RepID=A0A2R5G721_9STRA|nr:Two pore calcium channel protein 1 [Hondaea fermentalgiana]|eukprot:GBG26325.1 Two pore calcium channel protein 1 [Hondaea fermentalgiana]